MRREWGMKPDVILDNDGLDTEKLSTNRYSKLGSISVVVQVNLIGGELKGAVTRTLCDPIST
jgi:hypothetical protein